MKIKIWNIFLVTAIIAVVGLLMWFAAIISSKAQVIETVSEQLIKVYETGLPYENLSDEARKSIRIRFLGNVHECAKDCNTIEAFFRLAFADDMRFNKVVLLVAYLNLQRNQLVFFYIYEGWLVQIEVAV